jgi:hypothetical protein
MVTQIVAMAPGTVQLIIFCMESEAYKMCEGWATREGDAAFLPNVMRSEY